MYIYIFFHSRSKLFFFSSAGIVFSSAVIIRTRVHIYIYESLAKFSYPCPFSSREKFLRVTIWKRQRDKYVRRDNAVA